MTKEKINRRDFLKIAAGTAGAGVLACSGLSGLSLYRPKMEFNEQEFAGDGKQKILVGYASKCGSTAGVAEVIARTLNETGAAVDLRQIRQVADLSGYDAVVLGSAIRMGAWLSEAQTFVDGYQQALRAVPVAAFTVCMTLEEDTPENRAVVDAYLDPVRELVDPLETASFAGAMDFKKLSFLSTTIIKQVGSPEGDFRDWDAIDAWAQGLQGSLV